MKKLSAHDAAFGFAVGVIATFITQDVMGEIEANRSLQKRINPTGNTGSVLGSWQSKLHRNDAAVFWSDPSRAGRGHVVTEPAPDLAREVRSGHANWN